MKRSIALAAVLLSFAAAVPAAPTETQVLQIAAARKEVLAGRRALERQDWDAAIERLRAAAQLDPGSADIQNLLGYANRMKGDIEASMVYYRRALEINPDHRGAHEYIGRSYLLLGQEDKAREHLAHLERTCGGDCPERDSLRNAITEGWPWRSGVRSAQRGY